MKPLDFENYKPSPELVRALIWSDERAIAHLAEVNQEWARQAIATLKAEVASFQTYLERYA